MDSTSSSILLPALTITDMIDHIKLDQTASADGLKVLGTNYVLERPVNAGGPDSNH